MGSGSLPGVLKACGSFMVQVFECIARELRQTLAVLNQSPTPAYGRDRLASESWGAPWAASGAPARLMRLVLLLCVGCTIDPSDLV